MQDYILKMKLNTRGKKIFAIVWAWFEIFVFAGMFFGWGSLTLMLKEDGVYGYLCKSKFTNHTTKPSYIFYEESTNSNVPSFINHTGIKHVDRDIIDSQSIKGCPEQDKIYNLGFAIASGVWPYFFGLVSHLGHRIGTRFIRIVCR